MNFAFRDVGGGEIAAEVGPADAAPSGLDATIARAAEALAAHQREDGHFLFDLEADAAIPAEYLLVKRVLGEPDLEMERRTAAYLRRRQEPDGGWPMLAKGPANISASVRAYLVLRIAGDAADAPHMARARAAILALGGAVNVNVFTRILLAYFGIVPWRAVPAMPVEIMHLPRWSPFHIYRISYWARATLVPLLVLMTIKPRARSLYGFSIDELFVVPPHAVRRWPKTVNQVGPWGAIFAGLDRVARAIDPWLPQRTRKSAIAKALAFVRPRLNGEDGLGAIYPSIANAYMMLRLVGTPADDPELLLARDALEKLVARNGDEAFCQPCLSPVWDTALVAHALMEAGRHSAEVARALDWLAPQQILDTVGDWAVKRPDLRPGGWAFQYSNLFYPDCDDTAAVALALHRARRETGTQRYDAAIASAREWLVGMQSTNGGWGAYDVDNDATYLNHIPFADHGALLDPPTPDVTARCLSLLGQIGERAESSAPVRRALAYLVGTQRADGSWFGRWGINHVYGTWSVLSALAAIGVPPSHPGVRRGVAFLEAAQNDDGGWGEDDHGYALDHATFVRSASVPSQTAWALIGLMAAGETGSAVARGIAWLERAQDADGAWSEVRYTGTGFPRVFYLRYDGYPKVFPLLALARWRNIKAGAQLPGEMGF